MSRPDLHKGLADVLEAETPAGVDEKIFADLKQALATVIQQRIGDGGLQRSVSWTPTGPGSMVNNLVATGSGPYTLCWTYRNRGDYDLNGEANIADLTPIGLNYGVKEGDARWLSARAADGDGNGEVNIADVTPIGLNYGAKVAGYRLWATDELNGTWTLIDTIPIATMHKTADQPCFRYELASMDSTYYRLWTYDNSEYEGGWSNFIIAGHPEGDILEGFLTYLQ